METIIFLIIVGIFSSIFGKAKGKSSPRRTKPLIAKSFDEYRAHFEQKMGNIPRKAEQFSTGQPVKKETPIHRMEEKYQEIRLNPVMPSVDTDTEKSVGYTDDAPINKLEEKTIINGIIWSEILGEPRAKKPYFSRKS